MSVTLRQLEIFVAVTQNMHFGKAAELLHISQPTVSQEIGRLERQFGVPLFDRSRRSVSLTEAGQMLAEDARGLLADAARLVSKVQAYGAESLSTVRVVASPSVVNRLLPGVVRRAEVELPGVDIADFSVETGSVSASLAAEVGDIGLGRFLDDVPGFRIEKIADEALFVVLGDEHDLSTAAAIDLNELSGLPLLLWSRGQNPAYYDHILAVCRDRGLVPDLVVSPPRIVGSRLYLLAESRAFSLVPESTVAHLTGGLSAVPLANPATVPLEIQYRANETKTSVVETCHLIRAVASTL